MWIQKSGTPAWRYPYERTPRYCLSSAYRTKREEPAESSRVIYSPVSDVAIEAARTITLSLG